jgi:endonuclease YncB( thermonuclease family)
MTSASQAGIVTVAIKILVGVGIPLLTGAAYAAEISGRARIVDGDTIAIADSKIRFEGIDAPETDQVCLDQRGAKWLCGITARDQLAEHVGGRSLDCTPSGTDTYHRTLAVCRVDGEDLNAWMVHEGWALAFTRYSRAYAADEEAAREAGRGLWSGAFIAPWDWRHRSARTTVLGAVVVPLAAQAELLAPASSAGAPSPDCIIKGNLSRIGEHIYHLPGSRDYAQINMAVAGKRWFCTEDEAKAAGWRPAAR